ncbi:MAG TPA: ATP-binding protein [Phototrophicaceae bacterium]|nr:ATP-binding protein [Phototrophicaceae bacterium]
MLAQLSRSLGFRLAISIVVIEIIFMTIIGAIYLGRFSEQIEIRQRERLQTTTALLGQGSLNLATLVDQATMSVVAGEEIVDAMLISSGGVVAFSLNPEYRQVQADTIKYLDQSKLDFSNLQAAVETVDIDGAPYLQSYTPFRNNTYVLYFRASIAKAQAEKSSVAALLLVGFLATVVASSAAIFLFFRILFLQRINELVSTVKKVESGNLAARSTLWFGTAISGGDEIGILQRGINAMVARLQDLVETLEARVASRTRDLKVAAEVSSQVTTELRLEKLLPQLAELTSLSFKLYHVNVFLLDEAGTHLHLKAATGTAGARLLEQQQAFALEDRPSLVAAAGREKKTQVSNDVLSDPDHYQNKWLPNTRAEAALPMIFAGELVGVLDLQSDQVGRFAQSELDVFQTLAEQLAVAVHNASQFGEVEAARAKAEQADLVKSAFLASMSHELRTPLNAIINFTRFVVKGAQGPVNEQQVETLNEVIDSSKHLLTLINDVLDMSKIEAGSLKLIIEDGVDLPSILEPVVSTSRVLIADKPIELQTDIAADLPVIRADRQRIYQVLLNIVSNACKFTEQGHIKISACQKDDEVLFSVEDTGYGIAPEDQGAVFEAFKQTTSGLRQTGGTGLGMPISKSLVAAHGGQLWFKSELDKGTTFYLALPIKSETLVPTFTM